MASGVTKTTTKLLSQWDPTPKATPLLRVRSGMISDAYIHDTGRIPREKTSKKMKVKATKTHRAGTVSTLRMIAIITMQKEQAAALPMSILRRPTFSMKK